MTKQFNVSGGIPYPGGVNVIDKDSINIAIPMSGHNCGIILKNDMEEYKIIFDESYRTGSLYCVKISGLKENSRYIYTFFDDDELFVDPYVKDLCGNEVYGKLPDQLYGCIYMDSFDWEGDKPLLIPFSDSIVYQLHVRGFTRHSSSGVKNKGTFEGIIEKIPYLKEIGITAIELLPSYEFLELEQERKTDSKLVASFHDDKPVLNYWGYKEGYYFSPKKSYAASDNASHSFKNMVKELHKNGIEVIMQFYFPNKITALYIIDVLRYWVCEYHVDGFRLKGEHIPADTLALDPLLTETKLLYYGFSFGDIYGNKIPAYTNLAVCTDDYMYDTRKLIKSDEGMIGKAIHHLKTNPKNHGIVHYITDSNGFTLCDLVSYDRKHNEDNGENNLDGNPYNASWNCGVEGKTKKKAVLDLRLKQMKNAFLLNMFCQSTPLILAGDEFANSQKGNNNAYCQDNLIGWLNWNDINKNLEWHCFAKEVISFCKEHSMLHKKGEYTLLDEKSYGYPDLSYHSEEPWKCRYDDLTRHFGMMYCGFYSDDPLEKDSFIYLAVNMHWIPHEFALPKLPKERKWYLIFNTDCQEIKQDRLLDIQSTMIVSERSIYVLVAK